MEEFKVNELITLRLIGGKTVLYVNNEEFKQCKYLLLNVSIGENFPQDINSIDDAEEILDTRMEYETENMFTPEEEFFGHCSNLQAWAENQYETTLLHRSLAFPLLKSLSEEGDITAKQRFKEEITRRYKYGSFNVQKYLFEEGYLKYLTDADILSGMLEVEDAIFMEKIIRKYSPIPCFDLIRDTRRNDQLFLSIEDGRIWELELEIDEKWTHVPMTIETLKKLNRVALYIRYPSYNIFGVKFKVESVKNLIITCFVPDITIPDLLSYFPNLENLRVFGHFEGSNAKFENSFKKLPNLKILQLNNISLAKLPATMSYLTNLTDLTLKNTMIRDLPLSLIELKSLKSLYIANNKNLKIPRSMIKKLEKKLLFFSYFN